MRLLVCLLVMVASSLAQQRYDVLLKGGHVIDPKNSIDAVRDVAIRSGRIAAVEANLDPASAAKTVDVKGLYVTPGLVDIHVHLFATTGVADAWAGDNSIRPDDFSFRTGVTTMVDAGSAGRRNFDTFRHTVIDRAKTRVFAFINVAGLGMLTNIVEQHPSDMEPAEIAKVAARHKEIVVGIKSAHYEAPDWTSVDRAVEAGKLTGLPVMVDFGFFRKERPYYELVGKRLRPGDISTHCYRASVPWVDKNGKLYSYVSQARDRGVKFDVGHGGGSFTFRNAVPAIRQGFWPDSISTDLHTGSMNAGMMDLPTTMSKFLVMGMPLKDVILRTTWNPAQLIHHPEVGHLTVGAVADVAVLNVIEGDFAYRDSHNAKLDGKQRIICEMTLRGGTVMWDWNSRTGVPYQTLGPEYGIRPGQDFLIPPPLK